MKKRVFFTLVVMASFGLTFFSCENREQEEQHRSGTFNSVQEAMEYIHRLNVSTFSISPYSKDSLDILLEKRGMNRFLDYDNYVAIGRSKDNPNTIEYMNIPYNTDLGGVIAKKFEKQKFLKMDSFSHKDYDKLCEWVNSEVEKGNRVVVYKEKDGTYTAMSFTPQEWDLIYGKK